MKPTPSTAEQTLDKLEQISAVAATQASESPRTQLNDLKRSLDEFAQAFKKDVLPDHERQYGQIKEEDIALQPRINAMREEDDRLTALMAELQNAIGDIDESTVTAERIVRVSKRIRGLVTDVRAQRDELSKWFSESLLRDRGFSS